MTDWARLPPLASLRAFAAYAETGSVARAGARLNVSHAAISQQIRALETRMGCALVDRSGRKMELSADGEKLAEALSQGFGTIARTVGELTGAEDDRPLLISVTPSLASSWLVPRLVDFRAAHPEIDLMIDASVEVKSFAPGGLDVALRYGSGDWPGLEAELLMQSPVVVVAAPSLVAGPVPGTIEALAGYPWLQEMGTNEASDFLSRHGVTARLSRGTTSLPGNMVVEAVRAGQGLAAVARVNVEADIQAGRLQVLFGGDRDQGYFIVTRPGVQRRPLRAFVKWLRRQARAHRNNGTE
jgi:LysR family glycine cleavage system transcriptional activator